MVNIFSTALHGDTTLETTFQPLNASDTDLQLSGFILTIGVEFPRLRCRREEDSRAVSLFQKVVHFLLGPPAHKSDQKGSMPEGERTVNTHSRWKLVRTREKRGPLQCG